MKKNSISKSAILFYFGSIGFIISIIADKISKGQLLNSIFTDISINTQILDFISGTGIGIAITGLLGSIIISCSCKVG